VNPRAPNIILRIADCQFDVIAPAFARDVALRRYALAPHRCHFLLHGRYRLRSSTRPANRVYGLKRSNAIDPRLPALRRRAFAELAALRADPRFRRQIPPQHRGNGRKKEKSRCVWMSM